MTALYHKTYSDCSGCSLCLLVCPVWRQHRDLCLTPHGFAKALQQGISAAEIAADTLHCSLCMACVPVCPENIDLVDMILDLRRHLKAPFSQPELRANPDRPDAAPVSGSALLPDDALRASPEVLSRTLALLDLAQAPDDGADISLALEAGTEIQPQRLQQFLAPLRLLKKIIVADGLLLRHLRRWLPGANILGLGETLSRLEAVRRGLRANDLYVLEPRAYHAEYQRLVKYYDQLRLNYNCAFNLDLQRIAIPATMRNLQQRLGLAAIDDTAQTRWVLQGRQIGRIVVENLEDRAAFAALCDLPVVHLAELA